MTDSTVYWWAKRITDLLYVNLLWLLASLPVVTAPAATTAMFGVVKEWVDGGDPPVARTFAATLKRSGVQGTWIGLMWMFTGAVLVADFAIAPRLGLLSYPVYAVLCALATIYALSSVYLLPVAVRYQARTRVVVKYSVLCSLLNLPTALLALVAVAAAAVITAVMPLALCITVSVTAYTVYWLCNRAFRRTDALQSRYAGRVADRLTAQPSS